MPLSEKEISPWLANEFGLVTLMRIGSVEPDSVLASMQLDAISRTIDPNLSEYKPSDIMSMRKFLASGAKPIFLDSTLIVDS